MTISSAENNVRRGAVRHVLALIAALAIACLLAPVSGSTQPLTSAASKHRRAACHAKGKKRCKAAKRCKRATHPKRAKRSKAAKRCKRSKKHKKHGSGTTKPSTGKKTAPTSGSSPSSKRTMKAGPVNLTPAERKGLEEVNQDRAQHDVAAIQTSPELQAIAEKRTREMAEKESDYPGDDIYTDITDAGFCSKSQREEESVGASQEGVEKQEQGVCEVRHVCPGGKSVIADAALVAETRRRHSSLLAGFGPISDRLEDNEEREINSLTELERIPIDPNYTLFADSIDEVGERAYFVEDFEQPC